jgi:hypothetical protein
VQQHAELLVLGEAMIRTFGKGAVNDGEVQWFRNWTVKLVQIGLFAMRFQLDFYVSNP